MTTKKWCLLFFSLILLSSAILFFTQTFESNQKTALIQKEGVIIKEIDLSSIKDPYSFTVGEDDSFNVISVSKNEIKVIEASCPDKVCVKHGPLKNSFSPIVCLPNKLTISLKGSSTIDAQAR